MLRFLFALVLLASPAWGQAVQQSGTVSRGHAAMWFQNGVIKDGGTAASGNLTSLGVTNNGGPGVCINSALTTVPFNQLCLAVSTSAAAQISLQNYGGAAPQNLTFLINGQTYTFPFSTSGVTGPGTTVIGHVATWGNTTGTLLADAATSGFVTGPGTTVVGHFATWANTTGTLLADTAQSALSFTSLTVAPTPATLNFGLLISETFSGTAVGNQSPNFINIASDNANIGSASAFGFEVSYSFGGAAMQGGRQGIFSQAKLTAPSSASNPFRIYNAATFAGIAVSGDGGTNTGAGALGIMTGINPSVQAQNGATNLLRLAAVQADVNTVTGSTATARFGVLVTDELSTAQAATYDAAFAIGALGTPIGWKTGLLIGNVSDVGAAPMNANATLIATTGAATVTGGIDFSSYTFSSFQYKGPGVFIAGAGNVGLGKETNPQAPLVVSNNVTTGIGSGSMMTLVAADNVVTTQFLISYGSAATNSILFRAAGGTAASPTQVTTNFGIGGIGSQGYNSSSAFDTTSSPFLQFVAAENHTSSAQGTYLSVSTTPIGSTARAEGTRFNPSGGVSIGNTTDPGNGNLSINNLFSLGTGSATSGYSSNIIINGGTVGTNAGGFVGMNLGGSVAWTLGNRSSVFNVAFDNTTVFSSLHGWRWNTGVDGTPLVTAGTVSISTNGTIGSYANGQIPGTVTNDNASAGNVGEFISSSVVVGSAVSLTNGIAANLTSISLTAGDWDVSCAAHLTLAASTTITEYLVSISETSATSDQTAGHFSFMAWASFTPGTQRYITQTVVPQRKSYATTTTVYCVALNIFGVSTSAVWGLLEARRRR